MSIDAESATERGQNSQVVLIPDIVTDLEDTDFGEGLSLRSSNEFAVLTWRERRIYLIERETLTINDVFDLPQPIREGWGITADESRVKRGANGEEYFSLYISDGSEYIFEVDGETFEVLRSFRCFEFN